MLFISFIVGLSALCATVLRASASPATTPNTVFEKWFADNGGKINAMKIGFIPKMGRGFVAKTNITEGEQILQIPHKLIFSTKNLPNYVVDRGRTILETLGTDGALYAWLLLEKRKEDSFFKPYLDILPRYVSSLVHFSESELAELQSATLITEAQEMQQSARADYDAFLVAYAEIMKQRGIAVNSENSIPYEQYLWAVTLFNSRGLRFQGPVYMAPMADVFNYKHHPVPRAQNNGDFFAKHHRLDASGITVFADRSLSIPKAQLSDSTSEGEQVQVFMDYGDNSDEIYLKYHGFVPDENPFRCAVLGVDEVVSDLVQGGPAAAATASGEQGSLLGKGLLPGATDAHRAMVAALEFNRLPSKCVDAVVPAVSGGGKSGGYFGKGLEVLLILLSFTEAEAQHCVDYVHSTTTRTPDGSGRAGAKNWPGIFKECGFSKAELFLRNVRQQGATAAVAALGGGTQQAGAAGAEAALELRVLSTFQRFLHLHLQRDGVTTGISEDAALLSTLQTQLGSDVTLQVPLLHRVLAVKYRLHRKQLLLSLAEQYGAVDAVRILHGKVVPNPSVAPWDLTGSEVAATVSGDGGNTETVALSPLPADAPLSERIRVFNQWFNSLSPIPCHIAAMEIPEFRLGTITTRPIKKGQVYLGISTTHGGIMDSATALQKEKSGVSALLARLIADFPQRDDFHELLFFLLYETFIMREKSFYWPYLSLLPTVGDMENNAFVPLLWAEEDIKTRLGPSDVSGLIADYHKKTKTRFTALMKMKQITDFFANASAVSGAEGEVFNFQHYQWATVILDSRAIWWNGKRHLVPMLDFVNCQEHAQDRKVVHSTVLDETGQFAITKAGRDFNTGEQLFENYGQPNHIYFTYHGFLLENNSHDCVHLELPLTAQDLKAINPQKAAPILQKLRLSPSKPSVLPVCLTHPVAPMVWAFLAVKTNTFEKLHEQELLGKENIPGVDALIALLEQRLQNYVTFPRSDHAAANRLLDAEAAHMRMVRDQLQLDRARLAVEAASVGAAGSAEAEMEIDDEL